MPTTLPIHQFYEQHPGAIGSLSRVVTDALAMAPSLRGRAVLDIGCGQGTLCAGALDQGAARVVGVDLTPRALALAAAALDGRDVELHLGSAEALPLASDQFDVVFCTEVLEHVPDVDRCLTEMSRMLKPGGQCVISHPNYFNLLYVSKRVGDWRLRRASRAASYPLGWTPWGQPHPIERYFNPYGLGRTFRRHGLVVEQVRTSYYWLTVEGCLPQRYRSEWYRQRFDARFGDLLNAVPLLRFFGYKLHWRLRKP